MNQSTLARAFRTVLAAAFAWLITNGVLVAVLDKVNAADFSAAFKTFVIGGASALVAGLAALITAGLLNLRPTDAKTKALLTFGQMTVAGLATVALADVTGAAAIAFGTAIVRILITAAIGAITTYGLNRTETPAAAPSQ
jgi:hypothetical protein